MSMKEGRGVYTAPTGSSNSVLEGTKCFLNGNVVFAYSRLGELESENVRAFKDDKGLVPIPKWDVSAQADYHTPVHDQAELGCILSTAKAFSAAIRQTVNCVKLGVVDIIAESAARLDAEKAAAKEETRTEEGNH